MSLQVLHPGHFLVMKLKKRIFDISLLMPDPEGPQMKDDQTANEEENVSGRKSLNSNDVSAANATGGDTNGKVEADDDSKSSLPGIALRSSRDLLRGKLIREVQLGRELLRMGTLLEPGYSLIRGRILRQLHLPTLRLAKLRLEDKEIEKAEFIQITRVAIKNMKLAVKCLEDFEVTLEGSAVSEVERSAALK